MVTNRYPTTKSTKDTKSSDLLLRDLRDLRGSISPFSVMSVLAAMMTLRWVDFQDAEAEAMATFDETEYTPILPAPLHWRRWCDAVPELVYGIFENEIPAALSSHGASQNPLLPPLLRILPAIQAITQLSPKLFVRLTAWLAAHPFETAADRRRLLEEFDRILASLGDRESGQFRTPPAMCDLLVALADPTAGERLYDPCFGFGGILTAACESVRERTLRGSSLMASLPLQISGVELNPDAYTIGIARSILAGAEHPQLELGNSLERESASSPKKEGFDVVICHPPWGLHIDQPGLEHFPVRTNDSTALFIQHALGQLKPNGRAVIVIPKGTIFRQPKFLALRQWMLGHFRMESIVSLPENCFLPYSGIKASVLIVRRQTAPDAMVRIVDATTLFSAGSSKRHTGIGHEQIAALLAELRAPAEGKLSLDLPASSLNEFDEDAKSVISGDTNLKEALAVLGTKVPLVAIKDICRVVAGRTVPAAEILSQPDEEAPVPYIRIGNIQRGQTMKPTAWVTRSKAAEIGPRYRLRAGDVLIAKAGTIGKTGVVRNGAVSGIASGSLFVLTPDTSRIDPSYLAAYIQTIPCQDWLASRSTGQTIQGLKKQFIEELPVPVPPLLIQEQVVAAVRDHDEDPIKTLAILLSPADANPLSRWIDSSLRILSAATDGKDPSSAVRFEVFGMAMFPATVDNKRLSEVEGLAGWANAMFDLDSVFRGSEIVPPGSALYGILQEGIAGLRAAKAMIKGHSLLESRANELTDLCINRLDDAASALWEPEPLECKILTDVIRAGEENLISCIVRNRGVLPLRSASVSLEGFEGGFSGFIAENTELPCTFTGRPTGEGATMTAKLRWEWISLNGLSEWREMEVPFRLAGTTSTLAQVELGTSPYFVSEPVGPLRKEMFIGREDVIDRIKHQLASGNTVLLEGNRRAGKTSILKQIEGLGPIPGRLVVYSSMQASEGDEKVTGMPSESVWRTLAKSIAGGLALLGCDVPLPDGSTLVGGKGVGIARACRRGISPEAPWEDFLEYAGVACALLADHGLGLVLMIDEFDKLQEGIDNRVTSPQIPENIRYLIQNLPGFSAILTGSRRMQRLRHEYWSALYGLGTRIGVTALEPEAAARLIRKPVEDRMTYSDEAVKRLIELTASQPFLIQCLCNLVFELAATSTVRSIPASLVEEAASRFVEDNEHFASLMDYTETDRRRFLLILVHEATKDPDAVTFGTLQQRLLREGIEASDQELTEDLRFLQDLELVDYHGTDGKRYALAVPLMGRWFDSQHDYLALLAKARAEQDNQL